MPLNKEQMWFALSNNYGDTEELTGPIYVSQIDGTGQIRPRRVVESGPQQHGQTLNQALLSARMITMRLGLISPSGDEALGSIRERMHWLFNAINERSYLDCYRPDGTVRRFDCYYHSGLTGKRTAVDPYGHQYEVLQLVCDDPLPYEWPLGLLEFEMPGGYYYSGDGMMVATPVETLFGPSAITEQRALVYQGSWEDYPVIRFTGPMRSPYVANLTTGEILAFEDDAVINEGVWWEVDCRYGYKYVIDSAGQIRTGFLSDDSDLATFHIAPHPKAEGGSNLIQVAALNCRPSSKITIQYITYWFGV